MADFEGVAAPWSKSGSGSGRGSRRRWSTKVGKPICMQHQYPAPVPSTSTQLHHPSQNPEKLQRNCSANQGNMPPISALFFDYFLFAQLSSLLVGKPIPIQFGPNQPHIRPSIRTSASINASGKKQGKSQSKSKSTRQSIHFHRNVRRLYVSSNAKLRTNMPGPPTAPPPEALPRRGARLPLLGVMVAGRRCPSLLFLSFLWLGEAALVWLPLLLSAAENGAYECYFCICICSLSRQLPLCIPGVFLGLPGIISSLRLRWLCEDFCNF